MSFLSDRTRFQGATPIVKLSESRGNPTTRAANTRPSVAGHRVEQRQQQGGGSDEFANAVGWCGRGACRGECWTASARTRHPEHSWTVVTTVNQSQQAHIVIRGADDQSRASVSSQGQDDLGNGDLGAVAREAVSRSDRGHGVTAVGAVQQCRL